MVGYNKDLFILPFDHRGSFLKGMFGIEGRDVTPEETKKVKHLKQIIYKGFEKAIASSIPQDSAAILIDEQFGSEILLDAKEKGLMTLLTTEKSGTDYFELERPSSLAEEVKRYKPAFLKALVRYNPEGDPAANKKSLDGLSELTILAYKNVVRLLIEPLIPATEEQLARVGGDKARYDSEIRPLLTVAMIKQLQEAGVDPDVWKIEGMDSARDYEKTVKQARFSGRDSVGTVVLGRGAGQSVVEKWISVGGGVNGVTGFAVGRTIFWEPLENYNNGKITEKEAADMISEKYIFFYNTFIDARKLALGE